jgi:hypothetical protein
MPTDTDRPPRSIPRRRRPPGVHRSDWHNQRLARHLSPPTEREPQALGGDPPPAPASGRTYTYTRVSTDTASRSTCNATHSPAGRR